MLPHYVYYSLAVAYVAGAIFFAGVGDGLSGGQLDSSLKLGVCYLAALWPLSLAMLATFAICFVLLQLVRRVAVAPFTAGKRTGEFIDRVWLR